MGERGNICMVQHGSLGDTSRLYFYTHWRGYDLPAVLASALAKSEDRWGDEPYLARIIFCELVNGEESGLTGFGITTYLTDNGYPILTVDAVLGRVYLTKSGDPAEAKRDWSFAEYVALNRLEDGFDALAPDEGIDPDGRSG